MHYVLRNTWISFLLKQLNKICMHILLSIKLMDRKVSDICLIVLAVQMIAH